MKSSNLVLTILVSVVMGATILSIGFPGWNLAIKPFEKFDRIEPGKSQSEIEEFLKARETVPRPKDSDDEWKKHPDAAWRVTYETGGKPETIVVWYNVKKLALSKEFGK